jgi:hypothetical protein
MNNTPTNIPTKKEKKCQYCNKVQQTHNGNLAYNCKRHKKPSITVTKINLFENIYRQVVEELENLVRDKDMDGLHSDAHKVQEVYRNYINAIKSNFK